jgi:hypothetical protein
MFNTVAQIFQGKDGYLYVLEWYPYLEAWTIYELGSIVYSRLF